MRAEEGCVKPAAVRPDASTLAFRIKACNLFINEVSFVSKCVGCVQAALL